MRKSLFSIAVLLSTAAPLAAQPVQNFGFEFRPIVGAYVPMGSQRHYFKDAAAFGAQAAWELNDYFHVVGTFGWANSETKYSLNKKDASLYQYDVGAEANLFYELASEWLWRPFIGLGGGGRTYDYAASAVESRSCTSGYGAAGTEFQRSVVAFRVEARSYYTCFESPMTGQKKTRNDGMFTFGIAYHVR